MTASPVRVTVPRPPTPVYEPYRCIALKHRDDPHTHCMAPARLYACGWRCDTHRPRTIRTTTTTAKEAA